MSGFTDLFNQLGRAGVIGVRTAAAAAPVVNHRVQRTLWLVLGGLAVWPLVITSIAVSGGAWNGWLVAIMGYAIPIFLALWAIITYWWLVGPALFVSTGRKFVGVVAFVTIGVMGIALYMSVVPVHNVASLAFAAMLAMAILVALVVASRLTGSGNVTKIFLGIIFVTFIAITTAIPAGGFGPLMEEFEERRTTSAMEEVATGRLDESQLFYEFTLLGETVKSEPFNITRLVPPNWDYRWRGPESARVHWSDGKSGKLTEMWGTKGGRVWFTGTAGDVVFIRIIPPGSD